MAAYHEWTAEDDQVIANFLAAGKSASKIGAAFGVSRNAVIGRIHRKAELRKLYASNGLKIVAGAKLPKAHPSRPTPPPRPPKPQKDKNNLPSKPRQRQKVQSASAGLQQTPPFVQPDPRAAGDPVPLVDLRAGCCKWPVAEDRSVIGGFLFCAAATLPERPYCATHAALAYIGLHYRKEAPTP